ncbi:MAG: hypothetical protein ACUVTD_05940 [Nitrososphaerales archaeon]
MEIMAGHYVRGLVPKKGRKIDVKVGQAIGVLVDDIGNSTPETSFRAFLALVDNIPLIIGFKDLLDKFKLIIEPKDRIGYIEF